MSGLSDILADDLDVVFCGLNPGLRAADAGHHFVGRGNRFWPVLFRSGFTPRLFEPTDDRLLLNEGCGLTTVVARPTASADEISVSEFAGASAALKRKIEIHKPGFVAFLGKKAYGAIVDRSSVEWAYGQNCSAVRAHGSFPIRVDATAASHSTNLSSLIENSDSLLALGRNGILAPSEDDKGNAQQHDDRRGCHTPAREREQRRGGTAPTSLGNLLFGDGGTG
jgi:TDG/mug DNA glycosylase family protein